MSDKQIKTDFSDWLVVSDIDGTLNNKLRRLPKKNYDAINEFVIEKKGRFTLASGRNVSSIRKPYESLPMISGTPAVILNGAGIYDVKNDKILDFTPINPMGYELVKSAMKKFPALEVYILTDREAYAINSHIFAEVMIKSDSLPHKRFKNASEVPPDGWGKVIFMGMPPLISAVKKYLYGAGGTDVNFMSSSIASFEMLEKGVHKGTAIMKIADMLGIKKEHTAAIGDYFNDFDMLQTVGLPACCGQAPKEMHEIAKFEACHCNKGAVGDLLNYIMYTYKEN